MEENKKSTSKVEITKIKNIRQHPNADKMELADVFGYTVCIGKGQFKENDLVAYIPPDNICPNKPEFEFLGNNKRITVKRLRGIYSQGLTMPAPLESKEGDDVSEIFGITHYEPEMKICTGGQLGVGPKDFSIIYDIDAFNRYKDVFVEDEEVVVTEKIDGTNCRFLFSDHDNEIYVGSHRTWLKESNEAVYWNVVKKYPQLIDFIKGNPGYVVYGEIYGTGLGKFKKPFNSYNCRNEQKIMIFDIFHHGNFINYEESQIIKDKYNIPWVPVIYKGKYKEDKIRELLEGKSLVSEANHIREGIVIKPVTERYVDSVGRVILKLVSNKYYEGKYEA